MIHISYICFLRRNDNYILFDLPKLDVINNNIYEKSNLINIINELSLSFKKTEHDNDTNSIQNEYESSQHQDIHDNKNSNKYDSSIADKISKDAEEISSALNSKKKDIEIENKVEKKEDIEDIEDIENFLHGIPKIIKFNLKEDEESGQDLFYHFVLGKNVVLICATKQENNYIREYLKKLLRVFEKIFNPEEILLSKSPLYSPRLLVYFSGLFYNLILSPILIPSLKNVEYDESSDKNNESTSESLDNNLIRDNLSVFLNNTKILEENNLLYEINSEKILTVPNLIDNITDISNIGEKLQFTDEFTAVLFLFLYLNGCISFKLPIFDWEIFERTHKSNKFLYDGSDEQKQLIECYGSGKIISLLSKFDGTSRLADIKKKFKMSEITLLRYIYRLDEEGLIHKVPNFPKINKIDEEFLPILVIQGLSQDDLDLAEKLEEIFDGKRTILDAALRLNIPPEKIKRILDKIKDHVD